MTEELEPETLARANERLPGILANGGPTPPLNTIGPAGTSPKTRAPRSDKGKPRAEKPQPEGKLNADQIKRIEGLLTVRLDAEEKRLNAKLSLSAITDVCCELEMQMAHCLEEFTAK